MDNVDYFAKNIKFLRLKKGLKQGEVCGHLGFSTSVWSEYEHGWSKPRFNDLLKIFAYFEVTASELLQMDLSKHNLNENLEVRKTDEKHNLKHNPNHNLSGQIGKT